MGEAASTTGLSGSRFILLTDIVSSSRLNEQYPGAFDAVLDKHNALIEQLVADCGGEIFKNTGDGYYAFFDSARECTDCAARLALEFAKFPNLAEDDPFLVRIVAHQGAIRPAGTEFFGPALNRASRLCQVCHPRQVILSEPGKPSHRDLPEGVTLTDLGEHHLRDLAEPEHLYQLNVPDLHHDFPGLPTLGNRPNNLWTQANEFIGRERELRELQELLIGGQRLVTLFASGGYGKSRLAAQLLANMLPSFERGAFIVELAPINDSDGIAYAAAAALSFSFFGNRGPEEQLIDYLREKELLLCFDNFEHVIEGRQFIADILKGAPQVQVLVTSREPLHIQGEQVYAVEPLPVSNGAGLQPDSPKPFQLADSVLLFADRASLVDPTFELTPENAPLLAEVCQELAGIPLAIELAAAWMDSFTLSELGAELNERLEMETRLADVPGRHRSLRASLDWSWNLLDEAQHETLMRLATFKGGCFAEAASTVLGLAGKKLRAALAKLMDKSWLHTREVSGQTRWFIRDAASREYVFEKLRETRDSAGNIYEQAVVAHARYFSELISREGEKLHGPGQLEALHRIGLERQNIYEALDTLLHRLKQENTVEEAAEVLLPILRWLWEYLDITDSGLELVRSFRPFKDATGRAGGQQQLRLWALLGCCNGQYGLGDLDAARSNASEANALAEALGNRYGQARALDVLGAVESDQGNYDAARELNNASLAIRREIGDRHGIAVSLIEMAIVESKQGNYDAARQLYDESLAIHREIGSRYGISISLHFLGVVEHYLGNFDAARQLGNESLAICREIGDRNGIASSLYGLGNVEYGQGNYDAARQLYDESLAINREIGGRYRISNCLSNLGLVESKQGNHGVARELHSESLAIRREIGYRAEIAVSLNNLGSVEYYLGNFDAARQLCNESLAIYREIGYRRGIAISLYSLGNVEYSQGNYDAVKDLFTESLAIRRAIGNRSGIALSLVGLGIAEYSQGNYDAARQLYDESLAIHREIGSRYGIAISLYYLGVVEYYLGNFDAARQLCNESLAIYREIGDRNGIASSLNCLGIVEYSQGDHDEARELLSEALTIRREIGNRSGICDTLVVTGCLLVAGGEGQAGTICMCGARHQAAQLGFTFDQVEGDLLAHGLAIVEHPEAGLPLAERERLKAQAEAMSLDELAEHALDALKKLKAT